MPLAAQGVINQTVTLKLIDQETELYKIALREFSLGIQIPFISWKIPVGGAHLFWVRYDEKGNIIDELHGLSCDKTTGQFKPIGWSGDILKVIQYSHKEQNTIPNVGKFYGLYESGQKETIVKTGNEAEITVCWNKALQAAVKLNSLNINYELFGYKLYGRGDQNTQEGNSNSIAYTLENEAVENTNSQSVEGNTMVEVAGGVQLNLFGPMLRRYMFIRELKNRGFLYQCTDLERLTEVTNRGKIVAYIGFDCTAESLHVGSLMQIMILRLLQQYGHKAIVIIGGATSKIGDPSGKDTARNALTKEEITKNIDGIKNTLAKFIKFGNGADEALLIDNAQWLEALNYLDFLRDFGSFFSVNRMLSMDSVRLRLEREQHMSFLEFNYMLLQAYDFYYLNKEYNCSLQIGGSDQWGNIVMGVDLTKKLRGQEVFGITTPLLTTAAGHKMGKTAGGAVWLSSKMLSPYEYYQYWRNCLDQDVVRFAKIYAEFNEEQMQQFTALAISDINNAKKQLAFTLTKICHGNQDAELALETATNVFEQGQMGAQLPTIDIKTERLGNGILAYELLHEVGLVSSKSEGRRLIRGKGVKINDQVVEDESMMIDKSFADEQQVIKVALGKKKHFSLRLT
ncbi:unnamed protein product [Didymodactylos carnosus]|uniref:Tyrosine--tRNA ligase n=1 Tax=Didymodactylos carnosus TaxID=1234261 RepID=A0A814L1C5_9BILA|nr:unnamed protein product [Didymodactylos carnosus]CAF1057074.1 unnamed protein product [Didymodactylos carnosus]CAF3512610.1 unnamed protein product [Didymodactylos carnosus]CAF3825964.1 unnamed protein product [Didymodactylos carnosus]